MKNNAALKVFFIVMAFSFGTICFGQDVKMKKDKVTLDGKDIFTFEKRNRNTEFFFYPLNGEDEVIYIRREDNETPSYFDDDFVFIEFPQLELKLETAEQTFPKRILKWMIENEVIDANGSINEEMARKFVERYDKNITNRTIR